MTTLLIAMTVLGVVLVGIGSFLIHNRRPGHRQVGMANEVVGVATIGLGWIVDAFQPRMFDLDGPNYDACCESLLGFAWQVVRAPVAETIWVGVAFLVGWGLAAVSPWRGTRQYAPTEEQELLADLRGLLKGDSAAPDVRHRPPQIVGHRARLSAVPSQEGWVRVSINDEVAHLLGPDRRSACGRVLRNYPAANDETRLCRVCDSRSAKRQIDLE